ncbi:hypothetical protein [Dysgonomonas sp. Marseille-P4361]|uniref:hypothetical protein n=1 Tax=Dysgonomonas sp. Marseille-P4361 TaxID=2161820 RepID=UPI000D54E0DA|nr:hypothetical protein [Dysgonomonas sp. Marseille-P4361]
MLEPVEIDINMNQNVSEESERATQGVNDMTNSVDVLEKEIARLEKVVKDMSVALAEQEKIIESSNADFGESESRIESMREALEKTNKELATYRQVAEQASAAVSQGADVTSVMNDVTEALAETEATLTENAQNLIDNQNEINDALDDGAESADTYSASNQILSEALKRVATALGIENTQVRNAVTNVHVITAAKKGWSKAVSILTTNLGLSTMASKALLLTGIGALVVGIGALVFALKSWYDANDANKREMENLNRLSELTAKNLGDLRTKYAQLRSEWQAAASDLKTKEALVLKNIDAYNSFGVVIRDVNDADKLFTENTPEVIEAMNKRAMAAAAIELAGEKYKESVQKLMDAEARKDNPTFWDKTKGYMSWFGLQSAGIHEDRGKLIKEWAEKGAADEKTEAGKLEAEALDFIKRAMGWSDEATKELEKAGLDSSDKIAENSKKHFENIRDANQKIMDSMSKDMIGSKAWNEAKKKRDEATNMLTLWDKTKPAKTNPEEKAADSLEKMSYDIQKKISDARVKAIHEGAERERAAAKAEYEQTQADIEQKLNKIAELEKKTGKPAKEQRLGLLELDVAATKQYENELDRINARSKKDIDSIFAEVNARFASELDRNIAEINGYYASLIAEAEKAGASIEEVQRLKDAQQKDIDRAGINDQLRKADLDEALELEKAANLESIGLTTIAEQTKYEIVKKYLAERIKLLRELGDDSANKEADILEERLKGMQSKTGSKSITGLVNGALFKQVSKGFEQAGMSAEDAEKKASSLFGSVQKGGATASAVIGEVKGMFGGLSEEFDAALDSLGSIAEGFATGGIAGGVMATIGQGIKMFSHYRQVEKEHQKALKELALAKLELQRQYNLLLLKEQLYYKQGSSIFGTDQIRSAANAINTYRDTMKKLKEEMQGDWTPNKQLEKALEKQVSKGGFIGAIYKGQLDDYKLHLEAYNKGLAALADVDIVTGSKKKGALWWRKRVDVYSPLLEVYDDLIDKEGNLNTARLEAVIANEKMSDENRALLQSLLDLDAAAKEAEEQLKSYLSQTFGGLGDSLADSIVTAFRTGEDAALLFKENVTSVLEDLSKQMVFSLYLKETFDKLEKDIQGAYEDLASDKLTEKQLSEKITNILGGFFGGLDADVEKANKFLDEFWKNAEANGFDRPEGERQGATGGFANASQDSINELTGGVYAVRQMVGDIRNDNREQLLIDRTILGQLNILVERSEYWFFLSDLDDIKKSLSSIESYGLKMKL